MSDAVSNSNTSSGSTSDQKYNTTKPADPETASIATFSSTAPLVKKEEKKDDNKKTEIDAQKLQEQALKSQIRFSM
ncbi:hypothetical protein FALBO_3470 [Fusarium albosuccineum]|uniref:Uncharacterized protein n=1 Tax=Fusarium albosuccineum TaxID=1237068 RepID=A0A8H4LL28_9HYPO|nr:hypothetical protein FALBO_3470 [Fusarium albosuccineum]